MRRSGGDAPGRTIRGSGVLRGTDACHGAGSTGVMTDAPGANGGCTAIATRRCSPMPPQQEATGRGSPQSWTAFRQFGCFGPQMGTLTEARATASTRTAADRPPRRMATASNLSSTKRASNLRPCVWAFLDSPRGLPAVSPKSACLGCRVPGTGPDHGRALPFGASPTVAAAQTLLPGHGATRVYRGTDAGGLTTG